MRGLKLPVVAAYVLAVGLFAWAFAQFYVPGKGFSCLLAFGGNQPNPPLHELQSVDYYVQENTPGYDGQYYVQIAMHPGLRDPELHTAVDNLAYRARRILFGWTAYVAGLGRPADVLQAYALQNAVCWLLLAAVLWWWFPPSSWDHFLRWFGVLFSAGMCFSVRYALVDGPSLLLIATGLLLLEKQRPWWGTAVLALSGLGKETNVLAGAALWPEGEAGAVRRWLRLMVRGLLLVLPLVIWVWYVQHAAGPAINLGARNFDWPFLAYAHKWAAAWRGLFNPGSWAQGILHCGPLWSSLLLVALTVQLLFLALRPQGGSRWWRVGMTFGVLMIVLGDAVWEGYPSAASRVLLPMQLAFNVLVPARKAWLPVLLLGNLTLLNAPAVFQPPMGDGYLMDAPDTLLYAPDGGRVRVDFGPAWYATERSRDHYWRWSSGAADISITNPQAFPLEADMDFTLSAPVERNLTLRDGAGEELWHGTIANRTTRVHLSRLSLPPGRTVLHFDTTGAVTRVSSDLRPLDFSLKDWVIRLRAAPRNGVVVAGGAAGLGPPARRLLKVDFPQGWQELEYSETAYWRWSKGPAVMVIENLHDQPVTVAMHFKVNGVTDRAARLARADGEVLWQGRVEATHATQIDLNKVRLKPGANRLVFISSLPPQRVPGDTRLLDLCVKDLQVDVDD